MSTSAAKLQHNGISHRGIKTCNAHSQRSKAHSPRHISLTTLSTSMTHSNIQKHNIHPKWDNKIQIFTLCWKLSGIFTGITIQFVAENCEFFLEEVTPVSMEFQVLEGSRWVATERLENGKQLLCRKDSNDVCVYVSVCVKNSLHGHDCDDICEILTVDVGPQINCRVIKCVHFMCFVSSISWQNGEMSKPKSINKETK